MSSIGQHLQPLTGSGDVSIWVKFVEWEEKPKKEQRKTHFKTDTYSWYIHIIFSKCYKWKRESRFNFRGCGYRKCFCNLYMNGKCIVRFVNIYVSDLLQVVYSVNYPHGYFSVSMSLAKKWESPFHWYCRDTLLKS